MGRCVRAHVSQEDIAYSTVGGIQCQVSRLTNKRYDLSVGTQERGHRNSVSKRGTIGADADKPCHRRRPGHISHEHIRHTVGITRDQIAGLGREGHGATVCADDAEERSAVAASVARTVDAHQCRDIRDTRRQGAYKDITGTVVVVRHKVAREARKYDDSAIRADRRTEREVIGVAGTGAGNAHHRRRAGREISHKDIGVGVAVGDRGEIGRDAGKGDRTAIGAERDVKRVTVSAGSGAGHADQRRCRIGSKSPHEHIPDSVRVVWCQVARAAQEAHNCSVRTQHGRTRCAVPAADVRLIIHARQSRRVCVEVSHEDVERIVRISYRHQVAGKAQKSHALPIRADHGVSVKTFSRGSPDGTARPSSVDADQRDLAGESIKSEDVVSIVRILRHQVVGRTHEYHKATIVTHRSTIPRVSRDDRVD